ncbi:hypothetical protein [Amphibacillus cookii]|uniref:hypothetical protein n=1 Tax=Amphibacillus cookii TaxID=767787 RepID=UPI00195AD470|nr:hypothetical protein [Amphibacillus cookii]MBM7542361.1 uncharacterized protein (DUF342 family) [Amphibacillus cookii]
MKAKLDQFESRLIQVEKLVKKLEEDYQVMESNKSFDLARQRSTPNTDKISYLQEVNEHMFQQNKRLRLFIEQCIDKGTVPEKATYYQALKPDDNGKC